MKFHKNILTNIKIRISILLGVKIHNEKGGLFMFRNLEAELARCNLTRRELASKLGCTPSTLSLKLNDKAPLSLKEAAKIKQIIGVDMALEELFADNLLKKNSQSA